MTRGSRTREHLQEVALRLFSERGFDEVTVAEIAAAAGVSHMTFFRHFPTKERVVLDDPFDPAIGRAVAATDPRLALPARVVGGLLSAWAQVGEDPSARARMQVASSHPAIWAQAWENNLRTEAVIVHALVETGADAFAARVATGSVLGGLMSALIDWGAHGTDEPLGDRVARALLLMAPELAGEVTT
ncbi:MAG: TetR family transcriptional regulator [Nocardioides sp.]